MLEMAPNTNSMVWIIWWIITCVYTYTYRKFFIFHFIFHLNFWLNFGSSGGSSPVYAFVKCCVHGLCVHIHTCVHVRCVHKKGMCVTCAGDGSKQEVKGVEHSVDHDQQIVRTTRHAHTPPIASSAYLR